MAGRAYKTEAVVLRSFRLGEADRVLHVYTLARGRMQDRFRVYGREGRPCQRCGTPIDKIRTAGRGTWYCPNCQRLERQAASSSSSRPSRSRRHSSV